MKGTEKRKKKNERKLCSFLKRWLHSQIHSLYVPDEERGEEFKEISKLHLPAEVIGEMKRHFVDLRGISLEDHTEESFVEFIKAGFDARL